MPKYKVIVECRNEGGTDIHCWSGSEVTLTLRKTAPENGGSNAE